MSLRIGLVGYGAWGKHHAQAIARLEGTELAGISGSSESTLATAHAETGAPTYADYRELVRRPDVDAVDVVVPPHLHAEVAIAALEAGKHVLLEKPMAPTLEQCDAIIAAAGAAGKTLAIVHELRYSPLWGGIRTLLDDGAIGEPLYGVFDLWRRPYRQGARGWRFDPSRVGSWILEEPIHVIDLATWYLHRFGHVERVYATANATAQDDRDLYDNFAATLSFSNSSFVLVNHTTAAFDYTSSVRFTGTKGAVTAYWSGTADRDEHPSFEATLFDGTEKRQIDLGSSVGEVHELRRQIDDFAAAIAEGRPPEVGGDAGREAVRLCLAAEDSIRSRAVQSV